MEMSEEKKELKVYSIDDIKNLSDAEYKVWSKLPEEEAIAYKAFTFYRSLLEVKPMFEERDLYEAYVLYAERAGYSRIAREVPAKWDNWFAMYQWEYRCNFYDAHIQEKLELEKEYRAEIEFVSRIEAFRAGQIKIVREMDKVIGEAIKAAQSATMDLDMLLLAQTDPAGFIRSLRTLVDTKLKLNEIYSTGIGLEEVIDQIKKMDGDEDI